MSQGKVYMNGQGLVIDPLMTSPCDLDIDDDLAMYEDEVDQQMEDEAIAAQVRQFEINYCM